MKRSPADDTADLAKAFSAREQPAPADRDCPAAADIYEAAAGRLSAPERLRIVDHLTGCAVCARAWRLAAELHTGETDSAAVRHSWRGNSWLLAAAASVVVVLGAALFLAQPDPQVPDPGFRDGGTPRAPESLLERPVLPREDFRLRWSEGPPGVTYTVRITDAELEPVLVESALAATELRVPPEALKDVEPGERLYWQVEMRMHGGGEVVSPTFTVEVR